MNSSLLIQLHPSAPGFWILTSLLFWLPLKLSQGHWSARQLRWLNMARWVLIPYAGLLTGSLSPRLMGLTGFDWGTSLGLGIGLLAVMFAVLLAVRLSLQGDRHPKSRLTAPEGERTLSEQENSHLDWSQRLLTILTVGAEQFHWSFLRGAIWEILLRNQVDINLPGYWAVWIAAAIALPEVLLQPFGATERLINVVILIMTSVLFIYTQNFWLCWILHAMAWLLLRPVAHPLAKSTA